MPQVVSLNSYFWTSAASYEPTPLSNGKANLSFQFHMTRGSLSPDLCPQRSLYEALSVWALDVGMEDWKVYSWNSALFNRGGFCLLQFHGGIYVYVFLICSLRCSYNSYNCSVTKLCPTLCDPMDCSMPGFPVFHHLPEFVQTHDHWVSDAIQPPHPLLFPSPAFGQSIGASSSASLLPMNIQGWFPLGLTGLNPLQSKRLSGVFSSTTIWKHQFFGAQPSLWSSSHIRNWLLKKLQIWLYRPLLTKLKSDYFLICSLGLS